MYGGFHRLVWAIAVAWVIYACHNGYGGINAKHTAWCMLFQCFLDGFYIKVFDLILKIPRCPLSPYFKIQLKLDLFILRIQCIFTIKGSPEFFYLHIFFFCMFKQVLFDFPKDIDKPFLNFIWTQGLKEFTSLIIVLILKLFFGYFWTHSKGTSMVFCRGEPGFQSAN